MASFSVGGDEDENEERPNNDRTIPKRTRIANPVLCTRKRPNTIFASTSDSRDHAAATSASVNPVSDSAAPQPLSETIFQPEDPVAVEEESEWESVGESESDTSFSDSYSEEESQGGQEEQNRRGNEVQPTEARAVSTPSGNGLGRESEGSGGPVSVTLTDPDVLDCPICFEPLCSPVYQCENGHIACSSCCTAILRNKCASCCSPIGYNRCRAIEKILDSVRVKCPNIQQDCMETSNFNKKLSHEKTCKYTPASTQMVPGGSPANERRRCPDTEEAQRPKKKSKSSMTGGKGKSADQGYDTESTDEEAEFWKYGRVPEQRLFGNLPTLNDKGELQGLAFDADTAAVTPLYLASQSKHDHRRLLGKSLKGLEMNASIATIKINETFFQAFRRWDIVSKSRDRYKRKYRAAKRQSCVDEAKKLKEELETVKKGYAELMARYNERISNMVRLNESLKQSTCKVSTLEGQLKKAHAEAAAVYDRRAQHGENMGRARLIEHFKKLVPKIERYGIRRFVESPAFNKATEVSGIRDFDLGFDLAVAQIKNQGLIPVTFDMALIGSELSDPRPATDSGAQPEDDVEVDWRKVEFGFVVEQMRALVMDDVYTGPLPEPIDLDREFGLDLGPSLPSIADALRGGSESVTIVVSDPSIAATDGDDTVDITTVF